MCKFISSLEFKDWVSIIQMIIAFCSALLLYKTFRAQSKLAKLEKRAKRASYLPKMEIKVDNIENPVYDPNGVLPVLNADESTKVSYSIKIGDNPVRIIDYNISESESLIHASLDNVIRDKFELFFPGTSITGTLVIPVHEYLRRMVVISGSESESEQGYNKVKHSVIEMYVKIEDVFGTRYDVVISLLELHRLEITKLVREKKRRE